MCKKGVLNDAGSAARREIWEEDGGQIPLSVGNL